MEISKARKQQSFGRLFCSVESRASSSFKLFGWQLIRCFSKTNTIDSVGNWLRVHAGFGRTSTLVFKPRNSGSQLGKNSIVRVLTYSSAGLGWRRHLVILCGIGEHRQCLFRSALLGRRLFTFCCFFLSVFCCKLVNRNVEARFFKHHSSNSFIVSLAQHYFVLCSLIL